MRLLLAFVLALTFTVVTPDAGASAAVATVATVATPPMGWASWNTFAAQINSSVIKRQVDALVSSGLKDAGYQYVNIDEGWWQGTRDAAGNITVDTAEWPGGMKAIADYIHSKGLKAGIYTDAGRDGCGYYYPTGRPAAPGSGSEGHYDQDFLQFSRWGFDFVKVDWCGGSAEKLDARTTYQAISAAVDRASATTGRPLVLSICNWGEQSPWNWSPAISTMWRTSTDIIFWGQSPTVAAMLRNFDAAQRPSAQSAGHYNDPDMLMVGMPGFSLAQNRTHLGLWAISGAPLLAGNDLTTMSAETRSVLTNREVLAVDQDPLGRQGIQVAPGVYNKILTGTGRRAVLLLNRTNTAASVTARWSDLGLTGPAAVRDLWAAADRGSFTGSYTATVPAQGSVLLTVAGTEGVAGGQAAPTRIASRRSGRCLDVDNSGNANGLPAQLWDCNAQPNQSWSTTTGKQLAIYGGKCLDAFNQGRVNGTAVVIWECNGQVNQQWTVNADGTIVGVQSGLCLDAVNAGTANGTKAVLWQCNGGTNQQWQRG